MLMRFFSELDSIREAAWNLAMRWQFPRKCILGISGSPEGLLFWLDMKRPQCAQHSDFAWFHFAALVSRYGLISCRDAQL